DRATGCYHRSRIRGREAGWARLGRVPAWCESNIGPDVVRFVREEAAFDEPYNTRLHPTHGTRSRVPRVPALRCVVAPRGPGEPERSADKRHGDDWRLQRWRSTRTSYSSAGISGSTGTLASRISCYTAPSTAA